MKERIKYKKGLSTVVTSLILVLLVLVAVGIIWVVVNNIIKGGTKTAEMNVKCLSIDISATAVTAKGGTNYDVTLKRKDSGEEIGGVKLVFFNDTANSEVIEKEGNIAPLDTVTKEKLYKQSIIKGN